MLSEKLADLAERFEAFQGGSVQVEGSSLDHLCVVLRDFAAQAQKLERHVVPPPARLTPADLADPAWGGNVVVLDGTRRRPPRGGGDAA